MVVTNDFWAGFAFGASLYWLWVLVRFLFGAQQLFQHGRVDISTDERKQMWIREGKL